jgi:putative PEP-CTERM system TPR-repeat lipoprotein
MKTSGNVTGRLLRLVAAAGVVALIAACGESPDRMLASARDYIAKGDQRAAIIQLKNVLQAAPDNGEARLLLGKASLQTRDFAAAEKELRRALELGQPADQVLPPLAEAMTELGQHEALLKDFGERTVGDPQANAVFQTTLGDAFLRLNDRTSAANAYAAALQGKSDHAPALLGLARLAAVEGKVDEALAQVDAILAAAPKLARAHGLKADLLLVKGDRAGARKELERAVESDPHFLGARLALISLLIDERDHDAAGKLLDETHKYARGELRVTYLDALLAFRRGDLDKARQQAQQVLKVMPEHVPTLVLAGAIDLRGNQPAAAESALRKAVALAPGHAGARSLLVQAYLRLGQPARARETLQPLVEKRMPANPQLLLLAGETYLANGDAKAASAFYQAAANAGTGQGQGAAARTRLGQIALATGRPEEGFRELEAASDLDAGQYQADLAIIAGHLRRNETDKAMEAVRTLEKKQPKNPLTFQMYGLVHLAKRDAAAARRNFERALELQPNYLPAAYNLGMLDLADKRPEDARKRLEAMIAKDERNDQLWLALADLQVRTGAEPRAIGETLQRAVAANPQSVPARLALIEFYLRTKDTKAALTAAQGAVAALPNDPRVLEASGVALEAAGETNQAIEAYTKLAGLQPKSPQPLLRLAALHLRQKDNARAIDALQRARKLAPGARELVPEMVQVYLAANRPDDALKEARELQKSEPKFAGGYALEGDIFLAQRKYAEAEKPYREALKLEPKADAVAIRLHRVLAEGGKAGEADALARSWMAANPKSVAMRLYLGERELAAKNLKAAAVQYEAAVAIDGNNAAALNNLAWIGGQLGDPKALGYAERAVKLAPNNAAILDTYGILLIKKGEVDKGLQTLARAAQAAPARYDIRLNHARALAQAGRKDEARREFEALQALPEDFPGKGEIAGLLKAL